MTICTGIARPLRVLVAGGSYGGLATTVHLLDHCSGAKAKSAALAAAEASSEPFPLPQSTEKVPVEITIVDERDGFYHLIGTPLALASESFAPKAWVKFQDIPALKGQDVRCVQGTIASIDPSTKEAVVLDAETKASTRHGYDFFVAATGLRRKWPSSPASVRRKNYLFEVESHIASMAATESKGREVVVVGGGAVGIEVAAELKMCFPGLGVKLVHSGSRLMSAEDLPDEFKDKTLELVEEAGVRVTLGTRLKSSRSVKVASAVDGSVFPESGEVELEFENGSTMRAGEVIMAVSKAIPSTTYLPPSILDAEGYVRVRPSLDVDASTGMVNAEDHFVVGDVAKWSGIKRCGTAMYMGMFVGNNIYRRMLQMMGKPDAQGSLMPEVMELEEIPPMLGLAVGRKAVSYWPGQGTVAGEDVLEQLFRDDLGFNVCWNHMMLGVPH